MRLDSPLRELEELVSVLYDRVLEPLELDRAKELADEVAVLLGTFGFSPAADLLRDVGRVLGPGTVGPSEAISIASLLDDARTLVAISSRDLRLAPRTAFRLLVVGSLSPILDELIWTAASQGLVVEHVGDGVLGHEDAGAIVVVLDQLDPQEAKQLIEGVRHRHPSLPVVAVLPSPSIGLRIAVAQSATTILDHSKEGPAEIIVEVQRAVLRHRQPRSVTVFGHGAQWLSDRLAHRGLDASWESNLTNLFASIRSGQTRSVVLTPHDVVDRIERHAVLRLIRTDPELRSVVVVLIDESVDVIRHHDALRKGADLYVSPEVDLDELSVLIKARLARRSETEPLSARERGRRIEPWGSAAVLIERMLAAGIRSRRGVGFSLVRTETQLGEASATIDQEIARVFRGEVIVTRLDPRHLVIAIEGIGREALIGRMLGMYEQLGLVDYGASIACVVCPTEARTLDLALEQAELILTKLEALEDRFVAGAYETSGQAQAVDVMIVDPDPIVGGVLVAGLERRGIRVVLCSAGLEALQMLSESTTLPRVVLMDLDQRDIDGMQLLRLMSEAGHLGLVRLILMSPRTNESELRIAFELGIDDFISKPFSAPLLFHRIRRALDR